MALDWSSWISTRDIDPKVRLTLPPAYFFKFPPSDIPQTLPPPSDHPTLAHPFTLPVGLYNAALSPNVPVLAALGYATVVSFLNSVNERRKYRPWAFSKTRFFNGMVITHNIILALYSAWTCVGMINALRTSIYPPWEEQGLAGTVDSLCKMHGPRGPGSAAVYGESTTVWSIANRFVHLGADGLTPESTDVGRIWNQGLAFYGWLFYLSKFYEVIDTFIIIAKGKKSSFLQTFHHAGAMLCMWAGMRYMSSPIWMFALVNSFIHSIMYTFYLCSALGVKVPVWFKKTLTTLQITQFVVGASYAFAHLFIKYQSPVSVPYVYHLGNVASSVASSAVSTASAVASDDWQALLRKLALRAAGREGLAQNVFDHRGQPFGIDAIKAAKDWTAREETRYRDELQWTHCLDTSGQAFAVLLNVVYLLPLTWLFANFFIRSYLRRVERRRSSTASQKAQLARESASDAARRSSRRLSQAFENPQDGVEDTGDEIAIVDGEEIERKISKVASKAKKEASNAASSSRKAINNGVTAIKEESSNFSSQAEEKMEQTISNIKSSSSQVASKLEEQTGPTVEEAKQGMATTLDNVKAQADSLKTKVQDQYEEYIKEGFEKTKTAISSLMTGGDGQEPATKGHSGAEELGESSDKNAELSGSDQNEVVDTKSSEAHESSAKEPESGPQGPSHTYESTSRSGIQNMDDGAETSEPSANTKSVEKQEDEDKTELSPKEQVQQQESKPELEAEASTGDAKENDSSAEQSSTQNIGLEAATSDKESNKEERLEQDTGLEDSKREDFTGQETGSEESNGQTSLKEIADSAQKAASSAVNKVQATVEDPPPVVNETIDKVQNSVKGAQDAVSQTLQTTTGKGASGSEAQDYEDQKESWIHIPQTSEAGAEERKESTKDSSQIQHDDNQSAADTTGQAQSVEQADSEANATEPEWFEKLTSGIDSPSKAKVDKIIDESEAVRTEPVEKNASGETSTGPTSDNEQKIEDKPEAGSKEEQDKIIDESEPVRDEVQDTEASVTTAGESEAGA